MRAIITFLVVAAALIGFAWWLIELPGTVSAGVGAISMTMPTSLAILGLLLLVLLLYIVLRLLAGLVRLPGRSRRMRAERNRERGETAVTRTLLALAGGDVDGARSSAQRGRTLLGDTPQTLLLAAYAARLGGDTAGADETFAQLAERKDAAFLGLRGLYQGAVARGDWDAANALARQAGAINPNAPWLRAERERLAIRSGSWKDALAVAGQGTPVAALATAAADEETDPGQARRLARKAWKSDPAFTAAALSYARRLREAGRDDRAFAVLRESWTKNPHPALGAAALAIGGSMARSSRADWLTAATPTHPESLLLRAEAAFEAGKLAEAQGLAKGALDGGLDERRVWLLLAAIAGKEDNADASSEALRRAANAPPDSHWRCEECGTLQDDWHPVCVQCGEAGRITWGGQVSRNHTHRLIAADAGFPILP